HHAMYRSTELAYNWSVVSGSANVVFNSIDQQGSAQAIFTDSGPYLLKVTVSDLDGTSSEEIVPVTVLPAPPTTTTAALDQTAVFSANVQNVQVAANVTSQAGTVGGGTVTFKIR